MNRRIGRRVALAAAALGSAVPLAGCGVFSPGPMLETPTVMTVSSGAFTQGMIPARYTCAAGTKAMSPPLSWAGVPAGTRSLALVVDDSRAPITPYVYWVVFDISPATAQIHEGRLPTGAKVARGSKGTAAYDPPCPPGPDSHQYRFFVYALNKQLDLPQGTSLETAWKAIAAATIGRGRLPANAMPAMRKL